MPIHEHIFVLMDINACTRHRGGERLGSELCGVLVAYGWKSHTDSGESRIAFDLNHDLALVTT